MKEQRKSYAYSPADVLVNTIDNEVANAVSVAAQQTTVAIVVAAALVVATIAGGLVRC